jgi:hypothetical protein
LCFAITKLQLLGRLAISRPFFGEEEYQIFSRSVVKKNISFGSITVASWTDDSISTIILEK